MKSIRSRDNPFYKELAKLSGSVRQRNKSGQTLLDGAHLLDAYLDSGNRPQHILLNTAALRDAEIAGLMQRMQGVPVTLLDYSLFAELSELKTPTGILALIDIPGRPQGESRAYDSTLSPSDMQVAQSRLALLLEDIQDPGNLGSMLRSAAAAGCDAVYLSQGCADAWSPRVLRAAMGGHFALDIHEHADLADIAARFDGATYGATLQANESLYGHDYAGNVAFAFGNEGAGLSRELVEAVHHAILIPMSGKVESLNAAAAAAVCLFEAARQRGWKS
ncbi:MAG: RNA methyltransferase [Gallionella sp.]